MKKVREILYVFLFCVPFAIVVYITALIGILIYKLYKMTNPNDIEVKDADIVSNEFSAVIRQLDIEEAKQTLRDAGYFVDNLWHVSDVTINYDCTEEQAKEVLSKALSNEHIFSEIWFAIRYAAEYKDLKHKEK
jgi:hypothetical protein